MTKPLTGRLAFMKDEDDDNEISFNKEDVE